MTEPRTRARLAALALLLLAAGCDGQDADHLARVSRKALARAGYLSGHTDDRPPSGWQAVQASLDEVTIDARVSARLRWDKNLAGVTIQTRAAGTVVELYGNVRDLNQRRRAVELAESTTGVEKVVDQLQTPAQGP